MLGKLDQEEIEQLLRTSLVARIGCNDGEKTYVVPVSFVYEGNSLLCHSRDGLKISMMRRNPEVCIEIDDIRDYHHWRCIIAWGIYEELTEEKDQEYAQQFFSELMLRQKTADTAPSPEVQSDRARLDTPEYIPSIFYRIHLQKITGRYEQPL